MLEGYDWFRKSNQFRAGVTAMLWIGTISAVVAVILGLLLKSQEDYEGSTVTIHQWSGIATMTLAILTVIALRWVV